MFTGLIEGLGEIVEIKTAQKGATFEIRPLFQLDDPKIGESIAVNGACLTVTKFTQQGFLVDVSFETLNRTNLKSLRAGEKVNLERALKLGDRLGGHLVSGHVDCTGTITQIINMGDFTVFKFQIPKEFGKYLIEKGSIAVDGISLTINECDLNWFSVTIIPHTIKNTTLQFKKNNDVVNLEIDMIAKYVEKLLNWKDTKLSLNTLARTGFLD